MTLYAIIQLEWKAILNLTKIPVEIITRKFFSGKTVVIRHAEDRDYAEKLQTTFTEAGIQTTIEEIAINENSSNTDDDFYNDFNEQKSNKNLIAKIVITLIAGITTIFFFFPSEEKSIPPYNSKSLIKAPIKQKASPSLKKVEESVPSIETISNNNKIHK